MGLAIYYFGNNTPRSFKLGSDLCLFNTFRFHLYYLLDFLLGESLFGYSLNGTANLAPRETSKNSVDTIYAYPKVTSQNNGFSAFRIAFTNLNYITFSKCSHRIKLACKRLPASLVVAISQIVTIGSKKQMRWIAAGRIVAFVEHVKPVRDMSVCQLPSHSMSTLDTAVNDHFSVRTWLSAIFPTPYPAFSWSDYFDSIPKFRGQHACDSMVRAMRLKGKSLIIRIARCF